MKTSLELCDTVQEIAGIVRDYGQYNYAAGSIGEEIRTASLCGLDVSFEDDYVVRLKAANMDLVFDSFFHRAANDAKIVKLASYAHYSFIKGDLAELEGWLLRLERFRDMHLPGRQAGREA